MLKCSDQTSSPAEQDVQTQPAEPLLHQFANLRLTAQPDSSTSSASSSSTSDAHSSFTESSDAVSIDEQDSDPVMALYEQYRITKQHVLLTWNASTRQINKSAQPATYDLGNRASRLSNPRVRPEQFLYVKVQQDYKVWRDEEFRSKLRQTLEGEIEFDGRNFKLFCITSSGVRESSAIFFEDRGECTREAVLKALGSFEDALSSGISKFMARVGHAFSQSVPTINVPSHRYRLIRDVKTADDRYCCTDGVGIIAPEAARRVSEALRLDFVPSAFQIRYAGFKGVVAVFPFADSSSYDLLLRDSMKKFESDLTTLEVLNWSHPGRPARLNHQTIYGLEACAVPFEAIDTHLQTVLDLMSKILNDPHAALHFLLSIHHDTQDWWRNETIAHLLFGTPIKDPIVQKLLAGVQKHFLNQLHEKMRIPVKQSRYLIGIIDETKTLKHDEVYVSIGINGTRLSLNQNVLVTRTPCLHPGDFRVVKAVDRPELRHLIDVIVFPCQSETRPITDMTSGGDLDGDMYFVCWDTQLVPIAYNVHPPANYTADRPSQTASAVSDRNFNSLVSRQISFLSEYQANNQLGLIYWHHDKLCTFSPEGAKDPKAMALAVVESKAIDSAKSGQFYSVPTDCSDYVDRFKKLYPDHFKHSLHSKKQPQLSAIRHSYLERLATRLNRFTVNLQQAQFAKPKEFYDQDFLYFVDAALFEKQVAEAKAIHMKRFRSAIAKMMKEKSPQETSVRIKRTVFDLVSKKDIVRDQFRELFMQDVQGDLQKQMQKASAWYVASYQDNEDDKDAQFGWIMSDLLRKIKVQKYQDDFIPVRKDLLLHMTVKVQK